jgi:hypothetical protein
MSRAWLKFDVPTVATLIVCPFFLSGFSEIAYSQNKNFGPHQSRFQKAALTASVVIVLVAAMRRKRSSDHTALTT